MRLQKRPRLRLESCMTLMQLDRIIPPVAVHLRENAQSRRLACNGTGEGSGCTKAVGPCGRCKDVK